MSGKNASARAHYGAPSALPGLGWLVCAIALAAALTVVATGPGYQLGLWDFSGSLKVLRMAGYAAMATVGFAFILILCVMLCGPYRALIGTTLALVIGISAAAVPLSLYRAANISQGVNDITTDTDNPPVLSVLLRYRTEPHVTNAIYPGEKSARVQRDIYPDIQPAHVAMPPIQAFARALGTATGMGWTVVAADSNSGVIEAYDRTLWYGFTDDIVIRVKVDGDGSRVDVRSKARLNGNDFGKNAERVRAYLREVAG